MSRRAIVVLFLLICTARSIATHGQDYRDVPHPCQLLERDADRRKCSRLVTKPRGSPPTEADRHLLSSPWASLPEEVKATAGEYYGFIPEYKGSAVPSKANTTFSTQCFESFVIAAWWINDINMNISFTPGPFRSNVSVLCFDTIQLFSAGLGFKLNYFGYDSAQRTSFTSWAMSSHGHNFDPEQQWYVRERGLRVFYFAKDPLSVLADIAATATLFATGAPPLTSSQVNNNMAFMQQTVQVAPRLQPAIRNLTWDRVAVGRKLNTSRAAGELKSGDALLVLRLDGLDPTLAWTMGFYVAHTAVILRRGDAVYVCEANVKTPYWPHNGVQCAEWETWLDAADRGQLNVALAPLDATKAALFDEAAAWAFVNNTLGLDYGYSTLVFSWLDTLTDNYPCLQPNYTVCETPDLEEMKAILLDEAGGDSTTNPWRQALNHRLRSIRNDSNTQATSVLSTLWAAANVSDGWSFAELAKITERDDWQYMVNRTMQHANETTPSVVVTGPSMVCCVFVCRTWKAAGVFGDLPFECAEQTLWDLFSRRLYDTARMGSNRPAVCITADPDATLCQVVGQWSVAEPTPDFNTRSLFPHMGEQCPSLAPNYERPPRC